ncbi:MAG TPA: metal ABC transporter ATP-binding protein [Gemmatimonadales bacterium]|nr:metal ABC transporter ATP-binding protein [Gemmatimonadales bacterium]
MSLEGTSLAGPARANALEVEHLTVHFGASPALNDLSFSVPAGAALAVIGPNGAGKTVLFRALVGAIPCEGVVRWAPGTRLGYVPQKLDLERNLPITGRDLLGARARIGHSPPAAARDSLSRLSLPTSVLDTPIGMLSGGQFQRLLMAFALLGGPTVLLLDEPTAGVDEPGQEQLTEAVHRLQEEQGVTVLMISHDLTVVYRYASAVLCLSPEYRCFGVPKSVLTPDTLTQLYGAPVGLHIHDQPRS